MLQYDAKEIAQLLNNDLHRSLIICPEISCFPPLILHENPQFPHKKMVQLFSHRPLCQCSKNATRLRLRKCESNARENEATKASMHYCGYRVRPSSPKELLLDFRELQRSTMHINSSQFSANVFAQLRF